VPGVRVKLVPVATVKTVALLPVIVHVPEPILIVRVPVPVPLNVCIVGLLLFAEKSRMPPIAPQVMEVTEKFVLTVQVSAVVAKEFASKVTVSEAPGTASWSGAPPDVVDQLSRLEPSQFAVPPFAPCTQKKLAILVPFHHQLLEVG
jgi:hypothetical protein